MSLDEHRWHYDYARLALDTGFSFQTYRSKSFDKIIGHVDIDRIIRERDVGTIEKYIGAVLEFSLDNDQTSVLDPTFVKIFNLGQLSVQYLLFCKKYLDNSVVIIKQEYQKSKDENKNLKRQVDELSHETSNYKKQIKELKVALNSQVATNQNAIFQCKECPKAFSTEEYLLAHIKRRHESLGIVVAPSNTSFQSETDKLQLEIKQLKERLNNTERFVSHSEFITIKDIPTKHTEQSTFVTELQQKFEHLKNHVDVELRILQTQKFEKEKYEKWFETFLSNKLNIANNLECKISTTSTGTQGELITNNCSTQTESSESPTHSICGNCQEKRSQALLLNSIVTQYNENEGKMHDSEELQEKLLVHTQERIEKFEELLQEKVTGSIEKLENQMQTFLVKINEIEVQRAKVKLTDSKERTEESIPRIPRRIKNTIPLKKSLTSPSLTTKRNIEKINVRTEIPVPAKRGTNTIMTKRCSSSTSESDDETESDESETDDNEEVVIKRPVVKISATSTLGRRSLTSLKEVAFAPEVLAQLQKEIEKVMLNRLEEVGVNPKSKSLPVQTYQRALGIVTHQASVIQKNVSNYMQIRRRILKDVDGKIAERLKTTKPSQDSKLKSLLTNFRNRSKNVDNPQTIIPKPRLAHSRSTLSENVKKIVDLSDSDVNSLSDKLHDAHIMQKVAGGLKNVINIIPDTDSESIHNAPRSIVSTPRSLGAVNSANPNEDPTHEAEGQTKGVLKTSIVVGSIPKKKVIFDLESTDLKENIKPVILTKPTEGGSTTSVASSMLDGSNTGLTKAQPQPETRKRDVYDSSDWELSEISSN